jgi:hypothetical protein
MRIMKMPSPKVLFMQAAPSRVDREMAMLVVDFFREYLYAAINSEALEARGARTNETEKAPMPCGGGG